MDDDFIDVDEYPLAAKGDLDWMSIENVVAGLDTKIVTMSPGHRPASPGQGFLKMRRRYP